MATVIRMEFTGFVQNVLKLLKNSLFTFVLLVISEFEVTMMIELHGWLTIRETFEDEDLLSQNEIEVVMQRVKAIIQSNTCDIKLQYVNGTAFLHTLFSSNHHTSEVDEIIETYKSISQIAIGSYGMIYLQDDEDKNHCNEFQVYIFKRGQCIYQIDTHFSPCIPTIESDITANGIPVYCRNTFVKGS